MVKLTVSSSRGNHARSFPYTGYLGLSPLSVQGNLSIALEEDGMPIEASSVEIRLRCCETEQKGHHFGSQIPTRVLYEVSSTLWQAPQGPSSSTSPTYAKLGTFLKPWYLVVPVDAIKHGAASTVTYKSWRIHWVLEGVIHHKPSSSYGHTIIKPSSLNIISYRDPPLLKAPTWSQQIRDNGYVGTCSATLNSSHYHPGKSIEVKLDVTALPSEEILLLKRISVELRRVIVSRSSSFDSTASDATDSDVVTPLDDSRTDMSFTESDERDFQPPPSLLKPILRSDRRFSLQVAPVETIVPSLLRHHSLASSTSDCPPFGKRDEQVVWTGSIASEQMAVADHRISASITGALPRNKTLHHWSIGETCQTANLTVYFYFSIKVYLRNSAGSIIELPPQTVDFASIDAESRALARGFLPRVKAMQKAEAALRDRTDSSRRSNSVDSSSIEGVMVDFADGRPHKTNDASRRQSKSSEDDTVMVDSHGPVAGLANFFRDSFSADTHSSMSRSSTPRNNRPTSETRHDGHEAMSNIDFNSFSLSSTTPRDRDRSARPINIAGGKPVSHTKHRKQRSSIGPTDTIASDQVYKPTSSKRTGSEASLDDVSASRHELRSHGQDLAGRQREQLSLAKSKLADSPPTTSAHPTSAPLTTTRSRISHFLRRSSKIEL